MAEYCGFPEDQFDLVFIILDKMDKIGWDGVKAELIEAGFSADSVAKYVDMFGEMEASEDPLGYLENKLTGVLAEDVIGNLRTIRQSVEATKAADFELVFDPTLVRNVLLYRNHLRDRDAGVRKLCGRRRPL